MDERSPSQTASMVAMFRALADEGFSTAKSFRDPVAKAFLSTRWTLAYRLLRRSLAKAKPDVREKVAKQIDAAVLRVLAIDEELERAVNAGCRQFVLLGAGLDSRAYRLDFLRDVHVFEVDHPQTQAWKKRVAAPLNPVSKSLTYVPVNFEKDDLLARLREAGHRAEEPTVWVWEGVVMYLTDAALRSTLRSIRAASAPGSIVLVHYHEPAKADAQLVFMKVMLRLWSEPQIGQRRAEVMAAEAKAAGLEVVRDTGHADWSEKFGAAPPAAEMARRSRLLVARV